MSTLGNKEIMAKNIRRELDSLGLNAKEFSIKLDFKYTTVLDWLHAKTYPRIDKIEKMANYFGIEKSDLVEDYSALHSLNTNEETTQKIPILGEIACGFPMFAEQNITDYVEEVADTLPSGNLFYLKCNGDSMQPTIPDKALVMIRQQETVENGEIGAVLIDNEATLKRVRRQDGMIILTADNPDYKPIILTSDNPGTILGKAIKCSYWLTDEEK